MWDTQTRIPFDASLLTEHGDAVTRSTLLTLIGTQPGITVDELYKLRLPGLFPNLRALHTAGLLQANTTPPRFFERATRVYPAGAAPTAPAAP